MSVSVYIPGWLLWFVGGCIVGAIVMRVWIGVQFRAGIGRMFGW